MFRIRYVENYCVYILTLFRYFHNSYPFSFQEKMENVDKKNKTKCQL